MLAGIFRLVGGSLGSIKSLMQHNILDANPIKNVIGQSFCLMELLIIP